MVNVRRFGAGEPLVALHGFTLTGEQFSTLDATGRGVVAPDLPGHGHSASSPSDPQAVVDVVAAALVGIATDAPLLGYSQGARLAISLATAAQRSPKCLILISGTAGIEDESDRATRRSSDSAMSASIEQIGIDAFIDTWTSTGLTSTAHLPVATRSADRAIRLTNSAAGLASALAGYGQGTMPSAWHLLGGLSMPVLIVNGENDTKYVDLGARIASSIGENAEHLVIRNAGHNPLTDQPEATIAVVSGFLDGHR